ncbi:MAG: hypothetical protein ABSG43_29760 [Solirubrobacteraceae bacterium]
MSIGVIFLLVLAGWWAGPRLCQIVGGGLVVITTLMWLFPRWISYNPLLHLAVTLVGAGMWWLGVLWQSGRDAGRGPLVWDLAVERVPTLLHSLRTRSMLALRDARQPAAEHSSHSKPPPSHVAQPAAGRGRWRWRRAPEPADIQHGTPDHLSDGEVIDGVAYDLNDNSGEEDDVILERGLREDVDRTLEHAREHLEPIVHRLFAQTGGRWRERLNTARWQRRGRPAADPRRAPAV